MKWWNPFGYDGPQEPQQEPEPEPQVIDLVALERAQAALSDLTTREIEASISGTPLNEVDTSLAVQCLKGPQQTWARLS